MPNPNPPDIRLVDLRVDLHLSQVLSDGEDGGGLQRRRDRLSHVHIACHDNPINRRPDNGMVQIDAGDRQGSGSLAHLSPRLCDAGGGGVQRGVCPGVVRLRKILFLLGHGAGGSKARDAVVVSFRLHECGVRPLRVRLRHRDARLRALEVCRRLLQRPLEQRRIDERDDVASMHTGIEVRVELGNSPGYLRSDLHRRDRVDGPSGVDGVPDVPALHRGSQVEQFIVVAQLCCGEQGEQPNYACKQYGAALPERDKPSKPFLYQVHSYLSATMGSSRDARRAG